MLNEVSEGSTMAAVVDKAVGAQTGVWQESPLVGVEGVPGLASAAFRLTERPFLQLVNVRGDLRDAAFVAAFERVVGCRPPEKANTVASGNGFDVVWLGPDEWLVRSAAAYSAAATAPVAGALGTAFSGVFASAVDVGSGFTVLEISGTAVLEVLSRGCPLDLHPKLFGAGQCAQSHYFKASVTLIAAGDNRFELIVRRSFADYFVKIIGDAALPLAG
ncbi:sarcosine oxidase subunit gamma family protein [Paraburkholderia sp.]|uniref:sarcosine oxidase subunit gamma n=1 Tax=Paraburkholderia sp. TaxID=1926495 RepID=UPI0023A61082|nr:sarcosine oxidase subunit gamma family protein [Paraburkholderia sp.]MDE1182330.1 sarcosine oxidase subunit gamma family protein [Paraburkholderia sp.]